MAGGGHRRAPWRAVRPADPRHRPRPGVGARCFQFRRPRRSARPQAHQDPPGPLARHRPGHLHADHELSGRDYAQITGLRADQLKAFIALEQPDLLPEVGSRMMIRVLIATDRAEASWIELQARRFPFGITVFSDVGRVKLVVGNYIAAEVTLAASFDP